MKIKTKLYKIKEGIDFNLIHIQYFTLTNRKHLFFDITLFKFGFYIDIILKENDICIKCNFVKAQIEEYNENKI